LKPKSPSRIVVFLAFAVLYAVLSTRYTIEVRDSLALSPPHHLWLRLLAGPFWYAILLIPITVSLAVIGSSLESSFLVLILCVLAMVSAWYHFTGLLKADIVSFTVIFVFLGAGISLGLQIPILVAGGVFVDRLRRQRI
jgi:hypothetical protein